ncbi:MAG: hypothetical protein OEW21_19655, partial [Betaproteobacteria bacterium]|nr:hypothetical protein [Betaproteobacteria bacterium]
MRTFFLAAVILATVLTGNAIAYELATHGALTYQAYQRSILAQNPKMLTDLGIENRAEPFGRVHFDI